MSEEKTIDAGGLSFKVDYRNFGNDRGPAIRVMASVGDEEVQLLRFDCFDNDPHYHYDPDGKNDMHHLSRDEVPDPLGWSLEQIRDRVAEMIRTTGYEGAADAVDSEAVSEAVPEIESAVGEVSPADVGLTGIHHNSVVVTDAARARSFYSGILGLKEVPYPSTFPIEVIWYELGEDQIHLMLREERDEETPRHVALQVNDAVKAREELEAKGVEIIETVEIPGADRFFINDPEGNRIELIEWKVPWGEGPM